MLTYGLAIGVLFSVVEFHDHSILKFAFDIYFSCSFGGAEIHTIASYMGGVAAQETIKIITRQYVPINNTYLYNGASQTSTILQL